MKKLNIKYFSILALVFMVGCEAPTVGYNTYERAKDYKFSLGSEESMKLLCLLIKHGTNVILKQ